MIAVVSLMFISSLARVTRTPLDDLSHAIKSSGACTDEDVATMQAAGGGNSDNNFPGMCADCASTSWSAFFGFVEEKFAFCLVHTINISDGCAMCFAGMGKYAYDNCKKICLDDWCASPCLDCVEPYQTTLDQCTGHDNTEIPQPTPC